MDLDGHYFHALYQYMFYMWVQNCTPIESFFNKMLNAKHGFSSKVEYRAVIWHLKTSKEIHDEKPMFMGLLYHLMLRFNSG